MAKPQCKTCGMRKVCRDSARSWIFFAVGVLATVALRVIGPLSNVNPFYGKIGWYVGVAGFFIFFVYKYRILSARTKLIQKTGLVEKLAGNQQLTTQESTLLAEITCSQTSWKERANFFIIFALSLAALIIALYFDLKN